MRNRSKNNRGSHGSRNSSEIPCFLENFLIFFQFSCIFPVTFENNSVKHDIHLNHGCCCCFVVGVEGQG